MSDISKEFLEELNSEFAKRYSSSKKISSLVEKIKKGKATSQDAFDYAKEVGNLRKLVLHDYITDEVLNDGYLGYKNALTLFNDVLYENYELINQYCKNTFTQVNKNSGINLNGLSVDYDQDKTDGIVECAVKDRYTVTRDETEEAVVTNAKSYYDSSVRKNADFQYKSGLRPKIIRTAVGKTCKWCQSLAGTYDYGTLSEYDVFRRHSNCDCIVVYQPSKGKYQDVWSKKIINNKEYQQTIKQRIIKLNSSNSGLTKPKSYSERGILVEENIKSYISSTKNRGDYVEVNNYITDEELRILTVETGDEYAKIIFNNSTILIHGDENFTNIPENILEKIKKENGFLEMHSHPYKGDFMPSKEDIEALSKLSLINGQESSKIVSSDGIVATYNRYGIISVQESVEEATQDRKDAWIKLFGDK